MIHTSTITEVNQAEIDWSFNKLHILCGQYIYFNNIDHFDYSTYHVNIYFPIFKSQVQVNIYAGLLCKNISESILYVLRISYWWDIRAIYRQY